MSSPVITNNVCPPLGDSIPSGLPHAISVSLPTWKDVVGYEEGERRVLDAMCTGYPRFFIHKSIQKLAAICERKFGLQNERCLLVPKATIANRCRDFIHARWPDADHPPTVRLAQFFIHSNQSAPLTGESPGAIALHIVLFPSEAFPIAKQFWQHTGLGISSRMAERCLSLLADHPGPHTDRGFVSSTSPKRHNKYYTAKGIASLHTSTNPSMDLGDDQETHSFVDQTTYLEERYARTMPLSEAAAAKRTLRRRIAGVLAHDDDSLCLDEQDLRPSTRGVRDVSENEVYLFPSGMSAIWTAHQLCLNTLPASKSVCFGFPYTDTLKILQKWGPGCYFFGKGTDTDIDALSTLLASPDAPRILALFCEFPSNPLLRSADLIRLRALADQHGFVLVVDETVGNFINVSILPHADIVVSSLTKVFSGESDVMGGSLVLNPQSKYFKALKTKLDETYEDVYWDEDAIYMERNSRNFAKRVQIINRNAEAVCDFLHSRSSNNSENSIIKKVHYPKWETRSNYDKFRLLSPAGAADGYEEGNYGGLFSVTFVSKSASQAFFDALPCAKGPSLGTNFTLACPYTILAHYTELEWATENGVEESLVRVSVGLEDQEVLLKWFSESLSHAEQIHLKT